MKPLTIIQKPTISTEPVLTIDPTEVTLEKEEGKTASVSVITNQENITVSISDNDREWLSAVLDGNTLTITSLTANTGETARTATVTLTSEAADPVQLVVNQEPTPANLIGTAYNNEGIIYWQNPENPKEIKVLHKLAGAGKPWSTVKTQTGCTGNLPTEEANNIIKNQPDYKNGNSYAVEYCESLGEGWMLPSRSDMEEIFFLYNGTTTAEATVANPESISPAEKKSRKALDDAILAIGGTPLNTKADNAAGDSSWICNETSTDKATYIRWGKLLIDAGDKTSAARTARCVKTVTLP